MRRALPPLWLAAPSRYAAATPAQARLILAALAGLLVAAMLTTAIPAPVTPGHAADAGRGDLALYAAIVDGVRGGGNYYAVASDALRNGGYPLRPFVTFRLPALAMMQATLPPWMVATLLYALAFAVMMAWYARLRVALRRPVALVLAMLLLAGGAAACWQVALAGFHEVWAALLIALSLARYRSGGWWEAVGWAAAAALIRETAALYVLVMAALAWWQGDRRQLLAWAGLAAALALVLALHAHAVAEVVRPFDPGSPGWAGLLGPGFVVRSLHAATALSLLPLWLAAPLLPLAWFGWTAWQAPVGLRAAATLAAYALLLAFAGRPDTFYWGLLVAPLALVGLTFAGDGLRDLVAAALDRRRIVVRRVGV